MKKIMLLLSLCLAFSLTSCSSPSNNQSSDVTKKEVESVNLDFLNKNDIMTLPDTGFTQPTWISITQNINGTEGVFFINVSDTNIVKYGTLDGLQDKIPNGLSYEGFIAAKKTSAGLLTKSYPYWCEIDNLTYKIHKNELPLYLKSK